LRSSNFAATHLALDGHRPSNPTATGPAIHGHRPSDTTATGPAIRRPQAQHSDGHRPSHPRPQGQRYDGLSHMHIKEKTHKRTRFDAAFHLFPLVRLMTTCSSSFLLWPVAEHWACRPDAPHEMRLLGGCHIPGLSPSPPPAPLSPSQTFRAIFPLGD
jgi:hypothetical protein